PARRPNSLATGRPPCDGEAVSGAAGVRAGRARGGRADMNGDPGPTWQTCLWASLGCYSLFYVIANVLVERVIGSPKPPGSALPVLLLEYAVAVLVAGYWAVLGYRAEFAAHGPGQWAAALA